MYYVLIYLADTPAHTPSVFFLYVHILEMNIQNNTVLYYYEY